MGSGKQEVGPTSSGAGRDGGPWAVVAAVTLSALALYTYTALPTVPFGDGPELIAAAACLGVAHPPGYPLYTLLAWVALQFPAGDPAWRVNLLSGLFAALACGTAGWLILRLTSSRAGAVAAGLALAVSSTFWSVATVAEVYSLHLLLLLSMLCAAAVVGDARDESARGRALVAAAAFLGAGLGHHPTIVLALPAAACLTAGGGRESTGPRRRLRDLWPRVWWGYWILAVACAAAIPAVLYWSLLVRARLDPPSNWGRVVSFDALLNHARALSYRHLDLGWAGLLRGAAWQRLGAAIPRELSPLVLLPALIGLFGFPRPKSGVPWRPRLAFGLLMLATALFGVRYATSDVEVFYLPLFAGLALSAGLGIAMLVANPRREVRVAGVTVAVLVLVFTLAGNLPARNLRGETAAEDFARDILDTVPAGGVLFVESMDAFGVLYLTHVAGERPDVTIYDRTGNLFRNLHEDFPLRKDRGETWLAYRARSEQAFIDRELSRAEPRAVMFRGWPGYEAPPQYRIEPVGLLYRVRPATDPEEDTTRPWTGYRAESVKAYAVRTADPIALSVAATYPMARAERAIFDGDRTSADRLFAEVDGLAPHDAGLHSYVGIVYARHGDLEQAIEWFRRATEIRPSSYKAWNNLAMAYEITGNLEGAKRALRRSLEVAPGQQDVASSLRRLEQKGTDPVR